MKRFNLTSTKKGAASLYVVIFATILFGVITLSFIRIILSESAQSNKDDLSRSAYDSALAGVEDAKIAVNKYYQCQTNPSGDGCGRYTSGSIFGGDCTNFKLKNNVLGLYSESEVKIQETNSGGNNTDQAYTCVIINNVVSDYRSTLTSDTRTRVIPLGVGSQELSRVRRVEFRWYSSINGTDFKNVNDAGEASKTLPKASGSTTPPVISLSLLRTGAGFNVDGYNTPNDPNYSTMVLRPVNAGTGGQTHITPSQIDNAGLASEDNSLFQIECKPGGEFACTVDLDTYRSTERTATFCNRAFVNEYKGIYGADSYPNGCSEDNTVDIASGASDNDIKNAIQAKLEQRPDVEKNSTTLNGAVKDYCELWGTTADVFGYVPCATRSAKYCYEQVWDNSLGRYKCAKQSSVIGKYSVTYKEKGAGFFADGGNAFLIISLPYGEAVTDFVVTLYDGSNNPINFENVQISVDSTGRANQLLRRVETRLDPSDNYFPYPEYEVTLGGNGSDTFLKNFWTTYNCWTDEKTSCENNGDFK